MIIKLVKTWPKCAIPKERVSLYGYIQYRVSTLYFRCPIMRRCLLNLYTWNYIWMMRHHLIWICINKFTLFIGLLLMLGHVPKIFFLINTCHFNVQQFLLASLTSSAFYHNVDILCVYICITQPYVPGRWGWNLECIIRTVILELNSLNIYA